MQRDEVSGSTTEDEIRAMKLYGEILKRRRKERGVTLTELTQRIGINREVIEGVERGMRDLTPALKKRIKEFLRRQRII